MSGDSDAAALAYAELRPEQIIDTLEALSFRCDGRFLALNSYENRVYQIGIEDENILDVVGVTVTEPTVEIITLDVLPGAEWGTGSGIPLSGAEGSLLVKASPADFDRLPSSLDRSRSLV